MYKLTSKDGGEVHIFTELKSISSNQSIVLYKDIEKKEKVDSTISICNNEIHFSAMLESDIDYYIVPYIENQKNLILLALSKSEFSFGMPKVAEINGTWSGKLAGGSAYYNRWRDNPQYILTVNCPTKVSVTLIQKTTGKLDSIGFYFVPTSNYHKRIILNDEEKECDEYRTPFLKNLDVSKTISIYEPSQFAIIPCTLEPYVELEYTIKIESTNPESVSWKHAIDPYQKVSVFGEWKEQTAGGSYDFSSWIDNPQMNLYFNETTVCYVVLSLLSNEELNLGMYAIKNETSMKKLISVRNDDIVKNAIFKKGREVSHELYGEQKDIINIIPCTYEPNVQGAFEISVYTLSKKAVSIANIDNYYTQVTMISSWKANSPAGSFMYPSWRKNPHFNVRIKNTCPIKVGIVLSQKNDNEISASKEGDIMNVERENTNEEIGFYVYKADKSKEKKIIVKQSDLLLTPGFSPSREVSGELTISSVGMLSGITIIPATSKQIISKRLNFELRLLMENTIEEPLDYNINKIVKDPVILKFEGEWHLDNSGGSALHNTWTKNPHYTFKVTEPDTKVSCLLLQSNFVLAGFYVCAIPDPCEDPTNLTPKSILYKSEFSRSSEISLEFVLSAPGEYIIFAVTYEPNEIGKFSIILHSYYPIQDLNRFDVLSKNSVRKRTKVIEEILNTERAYVENLQIIVDVFMDKLLKHEWKRSSDVKNIQKIFSNIPTLLSCNIQLYKDLEETVSTGAMNIGKVFYDFSNFFRMYAQYCNDFHSNNQLLVDLKKKTTFKKLVESCENNPLAKRLGLRDYLIMPVQRIPRYVLLLEQVLKYTPPTDPDYKNLENSLNGMKLVASDINEKKRRADLSQKVVEIQKLLSIKSKEQISLATPSRLFIREGRLNYLIYDKKLICYCYLFNDLFLITQIKGNKHELKAEILLTSKSKCDSLPRNSFSLKSSIDDDTVYIFQASAQEERDAWFSDISSAIKGQLTSFNRRSMLMKESDLANFMFDKEEF